MSIEIVSIMTAGGCFVLSLYVFLMALRSAGLRNKELVDQVQGLTNYVIAFKTRGAAMPTTELFGNDYSATADDDQGEDEHLA